MDRPLIGPVGPALGAQVRRRREQRGLTASELARRAGIGKASLSKIESGQGNPTIDTLAALAAALHLPLTDLITEPVGSGNVYQPSTPQPDGEVVRELLRRVGAGHNTEVWRLRMPPDTALDGVPHAPGTTEYLLVASGQVLAGAVDEPVTMTAGDFLGFPGDLPHRYETFDSAADVTVLLVSPTLT